MNKNLLAWVVVGVLGCVLLILAGAHYLSLRGDLTESKKDNAQLQKSLDEKEQVLKEKEKDIKSLNDETGNLRSQNTDLNGNLSRKEDELSRKLGEVRKLQGSVKILAGCLIGVGGAIDAIQRDDISQARQSVALIETSCNKSKDIIEDIKKFPTSSEAIY